MPAELMLEKGPGLPIEVATLVNAEAFTVPGKIPVGLVDLVAKIVVDIDSGFFPGRIGKTALCTRFPRRYDVLNRLKQRRHTDEHTPF